MTTTNPARVGQGDAGWWIAPRLTNSTKVLDTLREGTSVVCRYSDGDELVSVIADVEEIDENELVLRLWGSSQTVVVAVDSLDGLGVAYAPRFAERRRVCELQRANGHVERVEREQRSPRENS